MVPFRFDFSAIKKMVAFTAKFTEMDWLPVDSYLKHVGALALKRFEDLEQKIAFIKDICKQDITWDEGIPGVNVPVHQDGKKRYTWE